MAQRAAGAKNISDFYKNPPYASAAPMKPRRSGLNFYETAGPEGVKLFDTIALNNIKSQGTALGTLSLDDNTRGFYEIQSAGEGGYVANIALGDDDSDVTGVAADYPEGDMPASPYRAATEALRKARDFAARKMEPYEGAEFSPGEIEQISMRKYGR